ncbi:hypothetical protein RRG08_025079 [Elysia crispata]|uniref:Uncharacterized protein n=1 Tax=Elysia crispata TaxID=231223 RepID=A0AAE1AKC9_9GAST|nr:hypothetical protein RRG08_025079 [Elysia crispata]
MTAPGKARDYDDDDDDDDDDDNDMSNKRMGHSPINLTRDYRVRAISTDNMLLQTGSRLQFTELVFSPFQPLTAAASIKCSSGAACERQSGGSGSGSQTAGRASL